jgi:hypothetical protein
MSEADAQGSEPVSIGAQTTHRLNAALVAVANDDEERLAKAAMQAILDGVDDPELVEGVGQQLVSNARKRRRDMDGDVDE